MGARQTSSVNTLYTAYDFLIMLAFAGASPVSVSCSMSSGAHCAAAGEKIPASMIRVIRVSRPEMCVGDGGLVGKVEEGAGAVEACRSS